jgi:predicted glycosyltransferase
VGQGILINGLRIDITYREAAGVAMLLRMFGFSVFMLNFNVPLL